METAAKRVLPLLQKCPDRHACVVPGARHVGATGKFVLDDVQNGELPVGFLRQRHRIPQCVQRRLGKVYRAEDPLVENRAGGHRHRLACGNGHDRAGSLAEHPFGDRSEKEAFEP